MDIKTGYEIDPEDGFKEKLSPVWQNPANPVQGWNENTPPEA